MSEFGIYVDLDRLSELYYIDNKSFDLSKLIQLCCELNKSYENECYYSCIFLLRTIIDHVPPIFGFKSFKSVVNNYRGSQSFKRSMNKLENSSRDIADDHLHTQIRTTEVLPSKTQVDFKNNLDVLLAEIIRILK